MATMEDYLLGLLTLVFIQQLFTILVKILLLVKFFLPLYTHTNFTNLGRIQGLTYGSTLAGRTPTSARLAAHITIYSFQDASAFRVP